MSSCALVLFSEQEVFGGSEEHCRTQCKGDVGTIVTVVPFVLASGHPNYNG